MYKYSVWTPCNIHYFPPYAKIITSTWVMKKKKNGNYHDRLNKKVFDQVGVFCYYTANVASPVTKKMIIDIVMVLTLMDVWIAKILGVKTTFLHGNFDEGGNTIYMAVLGGFE